jgi:hypothetical protein
LKTARLTLSQKNFVRSDPPTTAMAWGRPRAIHESNGNRRHRREHDIHRWSCECHQELLRRLGRHPLEASDASDREQRNISGSDSVAASHKRVAKLVENDDAEHGGDHQQADSRCLESVSGKYVRENDPAEENQEGAVNTHFDSGDRPERPRPAAGALARVLDSG